MTYKEVCSFLDELWTDANLNLCWGCMNDYKYEHHHIISRQECAKHGREDLLTDPENLIPLCYNCHHNIWHGGGIKEKAQLKCIQVILDFYLKEIPELYWKLKFKIEES